MIKKEGKKVLRRRTQSQKLNKNMSIYDHMMSIYEYI